MNTKLTSLLAICAALALGPSMAQAQSVPDSSNKVDSEWISYRDAYAAMVLFEKYGKSKNLIQNRLQIFARDKSISFENLKLSLQSKSNSMNLSLDALGQTQMPLMKSAYNENAELTITPRIGQFNYRAQVSLVLRQDGNYELSELRAACEQSLNYLSYATPNKMSGKKCVGIRFGFDRKDNGANLELRGTGVAPQHITPQENVLFWPDASVQLRVAQIRFDSVSNKTHLVTRTPPLIAIAVFE